MSRVNSSKYMRLYLRTIDGVKAACGENGGRTNTGATIGPLRNRAGELRLTSDETARRKNFSV